MHYAIIETCSYFLKRSLSLVSVMRLHSGFSFYSIRQLSTFDYSSSQYFDWMNFLSLSEPTSSANLQLHTAVKATNYLTLFAFLLYMRD